MPSISRRKVLSLGVAASAGALFPRRLAATLSPPDIPGPADSTIPSATLRASDLLAVAPVSHPSSLPVLDRLFPGLLSDPGFQQFLPVASLVTNVSQTNIRAFVSHWAVTTQGRTYDMYTTDYFHPRAGSEESELAHWGRTGDITRFTGNLPLIRKGATRLVTPFFNWSASYYKKNSKPDWGNFLRRQPRTLVSDLMGNGAIATMEIQGAITRGYASVGPRVDYLTRVFCVARNAEHDEAVAVRALIAAGASPEHVGEQLRRHATGLGLTSRFPADYYYSSVRQRQAKVLLRRLSNAPWEEFLGTLAYLRDQPKTQTHALEVSPDTCPPSN
jgi:hypothetical protein